MTERKAYVIRIANAYVSRTATRFGAFYGKVYVTMYEAEARRWTRRKDAEYKANDVRHHQQVNHFTCMSGDVSVEEVCDLS